MLIYNRKTQIKNSFNKNNNTIDLMARSTNNSKEINYKIKLSPYHKIFYNEQNINLNSNKYNIVFDQLLSGALDVTMLKVAINRFISDYVLINSHILEVDGEPFWIKNHTISELEYFGTHYKPEDIYKYVSTPFTLNTGPLYRFAIFEEKDKNYRLIIVCHHLIMDGASGDIFISEISNYYNNESYKLAYSIPEQIELIKHTNDLFESQVESQNMESSKFWKETLSNIDGVDLRFLYQGYARQSIGSSEKNNIREIRFHLNENKTKTTKELSLKYGVTPYFLTKCIFAYLIHKYTGQSSFGISYPVAIKGGINFICGVKVNTAITVFSFNCSTTISDLFLEIKKLNKSFVQGKINHKKFPINLIANQIEKNILKTMFAQTNLKDSPFSFNNIDVIQINHQFNIDLAADLFFEQELKDGKLNFRIRYDENIVNNIILNNFTNHFKKLLIDVLFDLDHNISDKPLSQYEILTLEEKTNLLYKLNQTFTKFPENKTITQLFEEQVKKTPDNIALVYENIQLTYSELNIRANKLAHYLQNTYSIKPDDFVVLCLDRNEHMLIGILAVLKVGGAYVPVDPGYPRERIKFILKDTKTNLMFTNEVYHDSMIQLINEDADLLFISPTILSIENSNNTQIANQISTNLKTIIQNTNLAYVIYTSGTTGWPKGVMVEHLSVVNLVSTINKIYDSMLGNRVLVFCSYVFDVSVSEIFSPLSMGSTLYLLPEYLKLNIDDLHTYIIDNKISHAYLPPALLSVLPKVHYHVLKRIIYAGEPCSQETGKYWSNYLELFNYYGPTETTIYAIGKQIINGDTNLIGKPINNYKAYILSANQELLPIGAIGELYVGGVGIARGYLNQPELTASKFIANPFQSEGEKEQKINDRLYKTGDLVRYLPDGNIEYIGRIDDQIKIRGYRVEPKEIENVLNAYPGIKQSVIIVKRTNKEQEKGMSSNYLVAYYVAFDVQNEEKLTNYLAQYLPQYCIPTVFIKLDSLPLNINGKLDTTALPNNYTIHEYIAPQTEIELKICNIYASILGLPLEKISISDDFFRLGGDSIIAIQICSKINQSFHLNISVKDIFKYRTINKLYTNVVSKEIREASKKIKLNEQGSLIGILGLLPIQEWFFKQSFVNQNHWNQSFLIKVPNLNKDLLTISLNKLVEYHDNFRLRYTKNDINSCYTQYYAQESLPVKLNELDISKIGYAENTRQFDIVVQRILTDWQRQFNIQEGRLSSFGYISGYLDGSSRVFLALHHLIVDVVSWRIILHDLQKIYKQLEQVFSTMGSIESINVEYILGRKGTSYRQWVSTVKAYKYKHETERNYWNEVIFGLDDFNSKLTKLVENETIINFDKLLLEKEYIDKLTNKGLLAFNNQIHDVLLTAFFLAIREIINQDTIYITLEGHGREEIDETVDISHTLGWFTSFYPVKITIKNDLITNLTSIKEMLRAIPNKGVGYGSLFGYVKQKLSPISFNYLGQINTDEFDKYWSITGEASGREVAIENVDYNIVNANGWIANKQLIFNITSRLSQDKLSQFTYIFKNTLISIIDTISNTQTDHLTGNDVNHIIKDDYLKVIQANREIEAVYLANSLQQGLIYHSLSQSDIDNSYKVQFIFEYSTILDIDKLKIAWKYVQTKYPSLRLNFAWQEELIQIVSTVGTLDWSYYNLSEKSLSNIKEKVKQIADEDFIKPYNLKSDTLFRLYLIKLSKQKYTFIFSTHHSILDGWSILLLCNYVNHVYLKLCYEEFDIDNVEVDCSYGLAQQYFQNNQESGFKFWESYLMRIDELPDLSGLLKLGRRNIHLGDYRFISNQQEQEIIIDGKLHDDLRSFVFEHGVTSSAVLQYVWHKILSIYGHGNTTVVGVVMSVRDIPIPNIEESVGLYINTLPVIVEHSLNSDIVTMIHQIQNDILNIRKNYCINLSKLNRNGQRLFESLFVYENYPNTIFRREELGFKLVSNYEKVDYPLALIVHEYTNNDKIQLKYAAELFSTKTINDILSTFKLVLAQVINKAKYTTLKFLPREQEIKILRDWNTSDILYGESKTIVQLFEDQVKRTPNNIALVCENTQLTYSQLNIKANKLAHYLIGNYKISPNCLIAICTDRSELLIISMIAALKSSAAYITIDPCDPNERIEHILLDTKSNLVLTENKYVAIFLTYNDIEIVSLDHVNCRNKIDKQIENNISLNLSPHNLAYIIYTSGTTGKPKGVMVEHGNVTSLVHSVNYIEVSAHDKFLLLSNITFDATTFETWGALLNGAQLKIVYDNLETITDITSFKSLINKDVTVLWLTKTLFDQIYLKDCTIFKNLNYLLIGGEALNAKLIKKLAVSIARPQNIVNGYGPTENTTFSCTYNICINNIKDLENIPIGKPITNRHAYILSANQELLPIGAIGELYVGGVGIARGYLNQPELTASKFIANPFQSEGEKEQKINDRLYKTGDLVRYLPDGNIEYIGRIDDQIKIRGYRVEPKEIENVLNAYPGIKQSVIIVKRTNKEQEKGMSSNYLVAYYVAKKEISYEKIKDYLNLKLPHYLVPQMIIHIESLPITVNGKIDIKVLQNLEIKPYNDYIAPKNEQEDIVCKAFAHVLGCNKISAIDDFFALGGDSIRAIELVLKLQSNFDIRVRDILTYKTPRQLAKNLVLCKDSIKQQLLNIVSSYESRNFFDSEINKNEDDKLCKYLNFSQELIIDNSKKIINNVLLTGATGFLGCNLLYQLFYRTNYNIFLLVRANNNDEAFERVSKKFKLYFGIDLNDFADKRLFVLNSDIEQSNLGLNIEIYEKLVNTIDSIIHSAALVKQYGDYNALYSANVQATINLLEFAKLTSLKDFHYISTASVMKHANYHCFTEEDLPDYLELSENNIYLQTKLLGEKQVCLYRKLGIKTNIYRVGNLAFMLSNSGQVQDNIGSIGFAQWLKYILISGYVFPEICEFEISPVDLTAEAVVKLFDINHAKNKIYHVFNPQPFNFLNYIKNNNSIAIKIISVKEFINKIINDLDNENRKDLVLRFLLAQGWLNVDGFNQFASRRYLQNKTQIILNQLNFSWSNISNETFYSYTNNIVYGRKMGGDMSNIFDKLKAIAPLIPVPLFWGDLNWVCLGANELSLKALNAKSFDEFVGKSPYDYHPKEVADELIKHTKLAITTGKAVEQEESIVDLETGKTRYFRTVRSPLYDDGVIVGVIGASIEITAEKEAEELKQEVRRLETENKYTQIILEKESQFRKIVDQVVHDIRSPIASMQMILPSCKKLPEDERISLNKAASRIMDIANRLLNEVKPAKHEELSENQKKANLPTLISSEILELIAEKKYEYKQKTIDFCAHIAQNSYFVFLNIISSDFKRMLSNLINNAVEAIKDKIGKIDLYLDIVGHQVKITLQDNGNGMPNEVREKILNNISVTAGKTDGHGIGFSQIRDTLENSGGILDIESSIGVGTKIILTFPQEAPPDWIARDIELSNNDIIVILDDDESIHGAWETRFRTATPNIIRKHFEQGEEAIAFINGLDKVEKEKVFLLTDYELLDQGLHGLHVVKQTGIIRSILVTSHHNSKEVRDLAKLHNTKILPKPLAPQIPIKVVKQDVEETKNDVKKQADNALSKVDIVLIDDDIDFSNNFKKFIISNNKTIDKYNSISELMNNISKYPKNICLLIDNQFNNENKTGIKLAEELHNMDYSNLYLFSGNDYSNDPSMPGYLTPILKTNLDYVVSLLNKS